MGISLRYGDGKSNALAHLEGDLDIHTAGPVYQQLSHLARQAELTAVHLDFSAVGQIDSAGVAAVSLAERQLQQAGKTVQRVHVSPTHRAAFELQFRTTPSDLTEAPAPDLQTRLRARAQSVWQTLLQLAELAVDAAEAMGRCLARRERTPFGAIVDQAVTSGINALPIVAMLSFLLGLVLGFQSAVQLSRFGADEFMAEVVALGMVREFGPLITAIILAGRTGAAMAAELGTMGVNEETDALRTMGLSPVRFLVLPRLTGITLVQPPLSLMSMVVGIAGGLMITFWIDTPWTIVYARMSASLSLNDFVLGLVKSLLFAWIIGLAGCFMGMKTRGGARSVGTAATKAVVSAIFFIVVVDSIVTTSWTLGQYE